MPLTTASFQRPAGRLNPNWFEDDLEETLTALLAEAATKTSDEDAQTAWVYHRAYGLLADDAAAKAAERAADDIRERFTDAQIAHWQRLAARFLADYHAATGTGGVPGPILQEVGFV